MPKISIGIPVYNGEMYLRESIESILEQTFPDFELIISDNASTDRTEEICREYTARDRRIRYFRQERNLGAARNFNFVLGQARSEYFRWMPHDDRCHEDYLAACLEVLQNEPETILVYPQTTFIDALGQEIAGYQEDDLEVHCDRPEVRFRTMLLSLKKCDAILGLIRTRILRACGGIGPYPGSDNILLGALSLYGRFRMAPRRLFYRRIHPASSLAVNYNRQAVAAWFDPAKTDKYYMHRSKHSWEYIKAICRSPLAFQDKCRCLKVLYHDYICRFWRHIGGEWKFALKYRLHLVPRQTVINWSQQKREYSRER